MGSGTWRAALFKIVRRLGRGQQPFDPGRVKTSKRNRRAKISARFRGLSTTSVQPITKCRPERDDHRAKIELAHGLDPVRTSRSSDRAPENGRAGPTRYLEARAEEHRRAKAFKAPAEWIARFERKSHGCTDQWLHQNTARLVTPAVRLPVPNYLTTSKER